MLSFSNKELEQQYQRQETRRRARIDGHVYLFGLCIWLGGLLMSVIKSVRDREADAPQLLSLAVPGLVFVPPWLLRRLAPDTYLKHRSACVIAFRLACQMLPSVAGGPAARLYAGEALAAVPVSLPSLVALAAQAPRCWALSLALRLGFTQQLVLQALLSAHLILFRAVGPCEMAQLLSPTTLATFSEMVQRLTRLAGMMLPFTPLSPPEELLQQDVALCFAVVATVHLVLGFFLPTAAVHIEERRIRASFLREQAQAVESEGLGNTAEQLGMPLSEVMQVCVYDAVAGWVMCLVLLLPLAASAWLAVLLLPTSAVVPGLPKFDGLQFSLA